MNPARPIPASRLAVQRLHFNFQQVMYGQTIFRQWTPPAFSATLPPIEQAIVRKGPVRSRDYAAQRPGRSQVTHSRLHARAATNGVNVEDSLKRAITNNTPFSSGSAPPEARCLHHGSPPVHAGDGRQQNRCHLFHLLRQNNQ